MRGFVPTTSYLGTVIVTTPQGVALQDARRGTEMFRKVHVPVLGIIQNMSVFCCPNCGHHVHLFGKDGARALSEELDVEHLGDVPLDISIMQASDSGKPLVIADPDGPQSLIYRALAKRIIEKIPPWEDPFPSRALPSSEGGAISRS